MLSYPSWPLRHSTAIVLPIDDDHIFTTTSTTWLSATDDRSHYSGYVEAGTKSTVSVTATGYDERPGGSNGCGQHGCVPGLAHDGISYDAESRWSCSEDIVPNGGQCEIEFTFDPPQDIKDIQVDFWKGDERTRYLKVRHDSSTDMFEARDIGRLREDV